LNCNVLHSRLLYTYIENWNIFEHRHTNRLYLLLVSLITLEFHNRFTIRSNNIKAISTHNCCCGFYNIIDVRHKTNTTRDIIFFSHFLVRNITWSTYLAAGIGIISRYMRMHRQFFHFLNGNWPKLQQILIHRIFSLRNIVFILCGGDVVLHSILSLIYMSRTNNSRTLFVDTYITNGK